MTQEVEELRTLVRGVEEEKRKAAVESEQAKEEATQLRDIYEKVFRTLTLLILQTSRRISTLQAELSRSHTERESAIQKAVSAEEAFRNLKTTIVTVKKGFLRKQGMQFKPNI
jgi:chromosome segregation ATPase